MPKPAPGDFDRICYHYEEDIDSAVKSAAGEPHDYFLRIKARELVEHLARLGLNASGLRVLDVGCGKGRFVELLRGEFREVNGIEPSRGMLDAALRRGLPEGTFARGHAESIPFDDAAFDVVFSSCIFHHTSRESHAAMAREMSRVLKPGGHLFTFEHNPVNPLTRWVVRYCPVDVGVTLYRSGHIERVCREAGLLGVETRYIVFFPRFLSRLRALEPSLHKLPIGGQYYCCAKKPER
ncbi:MAG: class I SAM-dependent methyltransferase [Elusimicrobia bacterium]|nr:class I SAM-dependent methyltransferase [Elusimicrobiota bacterium]